jgi:hypothetical protein
LQETIANQRLGTASYTRGKNPFIVIYGTLKSTNRIINAIDCILECHTSGNLEIVLVGRHKINLDLKNILRGPNYREHVVYIIGAGLNDDDFERADIKRAEAIFVLATGIGFNSIKSEREDEQNIIRTWGCDSYSPNTPLYVESIASKGAHLLSKSCTSGFLFLTFSYYPGRFEAHLHGF